MRALLLSGGVDSTTLAYMLRPELAISIDYGQRSAEAEIGAATVVENKLGLLHRVLSIDCSAIASGDMAKTQMKSVHNTHSEWWPFRNQLLITFAAASLVELDEVQIIIGSVRSDKIHRDGTQEFVDMMNALLRCQEGNVSVSAPANAKTTEELIVEAGIPDGFLGWTYSCHIGNLACGTCRGCLKRRAALVATKRQK